MFDFIELLKDNNNEFFIKNNKNEIFELKKIISNDFLFENDLNEIKNENNFSIFEEISKNFEESKIFLEKITKEKEKIILNLQEQIKNINNNFLIFQTRNNLLINFIEKILKTLKKNLNSKNLNTFNNLIKFNKFDLNLNFTLENLFVYLKSDILISKTFSSKNINFNSNQNLIQNEFNSNPTNLIFSQNLINSAFTDNFLNNQFTVFQYENDFILVYINNKINSIEFYNLLTQNNIKTLKKVHKDYILCIKYYDFNNINNNKNNNFIITSSLDNSINLLNYPSFSNVLKIENCHEKDNGNKYFNIYSVHMILNNEKIFIISSCFDENSLKLFDLNGNFIKNFCLINFVYFIDSFYYKKNNLNLIVASSLNEIKCFDFNNNNNNENLYKEFKNEGTNFCFEIYEENEKIYLITIANSLIKIFDFESEKLTNSIKINEENENFYSMCLWNKNYLILGGENSIIYILNLNSKKVTQTLKNHESDILTLKKIKINNNEFLLSLDYYGLIKQWKNNNNNN